MSTSDSTVKGKFDELAGKAKQAFGEATGDQTIANKGAAQEVKGDAEQSWGSVKEAAHDTTARHEPAAESDAHHLRDKVTGAAEHLKDEIGNAMSGHKGK